MMLVLLLLWFSNCLLATVEFDSDFDHGMPEGRVRVTGAEWTKSTTKLTAGVEHELIMNVYNGWSKPIQVFSLSISLQDPHNLDRQLRTLSPARLLVEVPVGEHFSIPFRFKPDRDLGTVGLDIQLDYTDKGKSKWHKVRGWLGVVEVVEEGDERGAIDWQLMLAIFCLISVALTPFLIRRFTTKPRRGKTK